MEPKTGGFPKRNLLFLRSMFRFHVSFQGCILSGAFFQVTMGSSTVGSGPRLQIFKSTSCEGWRHNGLPSLQCNHGMGQDLNLWVYLTSKNNVEFLYATKKHCFKPNWKWWEIVGRFTYTEEIMMLYHHYYHHHQQVIYGISSDPKTVTSGRGCKLFAMNSDVFRRIILLYNQHILTPYSTWRVLTPAPKPNKKSFQGHWLEASWKNPLDLFAKIIWRQKLPMNLQEIPFGPWFKLLENFQAWNRLFFTSRTRSSSPWWGHWKPKEIRLKIPGSTVESIWKCCYLLVVLWLILVILWFYMMQK